MKYRIYHRPSRNSIVISGTDIEDIGQVVVIEMEKHGWKGEDCWCEEVN